MTNEKNTPETGCCGGCECARCTCDCKAGCDCRERNCGCGCRTESSPR